MIPSGFIVCACLCIVSIVCPSIVCPSIVCPSIIQAQDQCVKKSACSCENSKGLIDLTPLASTGTAKFMDQADPSQAWFYSWNPCNEFSEGTSVSQACTNVAACQSDNTGLNYYNLGNQASAKFVTDTSGLSLQYSATTDITRTAIVTLTCSESVEGVIVVKGEDPPGSGKYHITLTSKYACPTGGPPGGSVSITVGSILVIIFIAAAFVYLVFGTAFMVFIRKASGREIIPNYNTWSDVLGLIKIGFVFTFTCGRRAGYGNV